MTPHKLPWLIILRQVVGLCGVNWNGMVSKTGEDRRIVKSVNEGGFVALHGIVFRIHVQIRSETHIKTVGGCPCPRREGM